MRCVEIPGSHTAWLTHLVITSMWKMHLKSTHARRSNCEEQRERRCLCEWFVDASGSRKCKTAIRVDHMNLLKNPRRTSAVQCIKSRRQIWSAFLQHFGLFSFRCSPTGGKTRFRSLLFKGNFENAADCQSPRTNTNTRHTAHTNKQRWARSDAITLQEWLQVVWKQRLKLVSQPIFRSYTVCNKFIILKMDYMTAACPQVYDLILTCGGEDVVGRLMNSSRTPAWTDLCFRWHPGCQPTAPAVAPVPHFSCASCLRSVAVPSAGYWTRRHTGSSTCPLHRDWPVGATREGADPWPEGWAEPNLHRHEAIP